MANEEQLAILRQGVEAWNKWRKENPTVKIDLSEAELRTDILGEVNFSNANLQRAGLTKAYLASANLSGADLRAADLWSADLRSADLRRADLRGAYIWEANLWHADLREADMREADLSGSILIDAKVDGAKASRSTVYGIGVWDLVGEFEEQTDLIITREGPVITVDNIEVAQFVYLILHNKKIRDVINTLTSKTVLILGRFADDNRKAILNALRSKLREYNLLPIVFDFDRPIDRNITETVKTLAGISYFVIADVTSPKSSPLELQAVVPGYQIPVVPIIQDDELPFSMINDLRTQHSGLLDPLTYDTEETLIKVLKSAIIDPAIEKHNELRLIKAQKPKIRSVKDFLDKEME